VLSLFTVDKKVLPRDYENKAVGFIVTGISNEVATNGWTTNLTSQMCLLDQQKKQAISKKKAEELLKELQEVSANIDFENKDSAGSYNILAALVADIVNSNLRTGNTVLNIDKDILDYYTKVSNYLKAICIEYFSDPDTSWLLGQFSNTYQTLYPITEQREDFILSGRQQTPSSTLQVTNDYLVKTEYIRNINSTKPATKVTKSKYLNIRRTDVLITIVRELSLYKDMVPEIKQAFDSEYYAFMADIDSNGGIISTRKTATVSSGTANTSLPTITSYNFTDFRKLDDTKVTDSTGLLVKQLPYIKGYTYLPPQK
jgi:hypothetical protein